MTRFYTFAMLTLAAITILLIVMALASRECVAGAACGDFWRAPATATAKYWGTLGADQWHIQQTEMAR